MEKQTQDNVTINEPSKGSQWRFWQKAYLAAIQSGAGLDDASTCAWNSVEEYKTAWKEMFKS
jgi:hypothetical protein